MKECGIDIDDEGFMCSEIINNDLNTSDSLWTIYTIPDHWNCKSKQHIFKLKHPYDYDIDKLIGKKKLYIMH